ncbi:hypothetical protein [Yokenella regensburgei]|uniref:hypothetical protein n=1 Tax=Yokenella regensburgei TaxID=158877 RepID=UPI001FD80DC5|nr:hypothetical protein [Yokenella regensburgei]
MNLLAAPQKLPSVRVTVCSAALPLPGLRLMSVQFRRHVVNKKSITDHHRRAAGHHHAGDGGFTLNGTRFIYEEGGKTSPK